MRPKKLDPAVLQEKLAELPGWTLRGDVIDKTFTFANFLAAMRFVNALAASAERAQHHPDLDIRYNKVTVLLTTHDVGGLTLKDIEQAAAAEQAAQVLADAS